MLVGQDFPMPVVSIANACGTYVAACTTEILNLEVHLSLGQKHVLTIGSSHGQATTTLPLV